MPRFAALPRVSAGPTPAPSMTLRLSLCLSLVVSLVLALSMAQTAQAQSDSGLALTLRPNKTAQAPGKPILADWSVANQGKKTRTFHLRFLLSTDAVPDPDDRELNSVLVRDLAKGQSTSGTAPLRLPTDLNMGPMHLLLAATPVSDASGYLAQTGVGISVAAQSGLPPAPGGAGNSSYYSDGGAPSSTGPSTTGPSSTTPTPSSGCDLTPIWLSLDPEQPKPGDTVRVTYQVVNLGPAPSPAAEVQIYLGPSPISAMNALSYVSIPLPPLEPDHAHAGEAKAPLDANLAPGTWYLGVIADPTAVLMEGDENNNVRSVPIIVE